MECGLFDLFSLINYFHYKWCALQDLNCLMVTVFSLISEKKKFFLKSDNNKSQFLYLLHLCALKLKQKGDNNKSMT